MAAEDTLDADKLASKSVRPRYDGKQASFATFMIQAKAWLKKNKMFEQVVNNRLPSDEEEPYEPSNPEDAKYWVRDNTSYSAPYVIAPSFLISLLSVSWASRWTRLTKGAADLHEKFRRPRWRHSADLSGQVRRPLCARAPCIPDDRLGE